MPRLADSPLFPERAFFDHAFAAGQPQLMWAIAPADLDTPVAAMLRLMEDASPCFLLESVEKGEIRGRYSVIGLKPDLIWRCRNGKAELSREGRMDDAAFTPCEKPPLDSLRALVGASRIDIPPGLPPMAAGLVGYMGYDMVRLMEHLPDTRHDALGIPDSCYIRPTLMVIFDAVTDRMFIIASLWPERYASASAAYEAGAQLIRETLARLSAPLPEPKAPDAMPVRVEDFTPNFDRARYDRMIERAQAYIASGDIFQVVLSQRFSAPFALPPFSLYRALRQLNPSPFLFYLNFGAFQLVGSSPEILVRLQNGEVTIRPIAGTRKRGRTLQEDRDLAAELLADPKEISEHLMLLDLGRNDVGRVARPGTVKTTQKMIIENYSHVMHIVSNVVGEIDPKHDALSAMAAGFPAGTVSGAPKVRAMQIIDELEPERRSFYAGCIGYFSANGNMDTAITLRTGLIKDGRLYVQAGGGIVAESTSEGEFQEVLGKSRALMRAAEEAVKFT